MRRIIRSEATEFHYERRWQPLPRILLLANEEKSAREGLTLVRIFEELRGLGYQGGYDAIRRYASAWRKARAARWRKLMCR